MGKVVAFYETDRRKIQENGEILADQLQAGKRTRPLDPGFVWSGDPRLRLVADPGILILEKQAVEFVL